MLRQAALILCLLLAVPVPAGATLVRERDGPATGAVAGGTRLGGPRGAVRLECWQNGAKIIDEQDLAVMSLSLAGQAGALTFSTPGGREASMALVTPSRTACLLKRGHAD